MNDNPKRQFNIPLDGRLFTSVDPAQIGKNFRKLQNMRYVGQGTNPRGIPGMEKIGQVSYYVAPEITYNALFTSRMRVMDIAIDSESKYIYCSTGSYGAYTSWNLYNGWDAGYYWNQPYLARVSIEDIVNGPTVNPYQDIDPDALVHAAIMDARWDSDAGSGQQLSMCVLSTDSTKAFVCTGFDGSTIKMRCIDLATMTELFQVNYATTYGFTNPQWFSKGITDGTYIYAVGPAIYGVCKIRCSDLALIDTVLVSGDHPEGMKDAMKVGDYGYFSGGSGLIMQIYLPDFTVTNEYHVLTDYSYTTIANVGGTIVVNEDAALGYMNTFNLSLVPITWNNAYTTSGLISANGYAWGWETGSGYENYQSVGTDGVVVLTYNYPMSYYDYSFSSPVFYHSPSRIYDSTRNLAIFGYSTGFVKWVDMTTFESGLVKLAWVVEA